MIGNAVMAETDPTNALYLDNQIVEVTESGYVFSGGVSGWAFHNVDSNRYTITNGTKYLKLEKNGLSLSDDPFILTVVAGTGDYAGKISIQNPVDKQCLILNGNTSFKVGNL